jgi:hypothetical protein
MSRASLMRCAVRDAHYLSSACRLSSQQLNPTLNVSAIDMIHSLCALLDLPSASDSKHRAGDWRWEDGFWSAWKALEQSTSSEACALVQQGIAQAINLQQVIFRRATELISTSKAIQSAGSFRVVKLQEQADSIYLCRPLALAKLGFFIYECGVAHQELPMKKPLVLCAPIPGKGEYLVVTCMGTMPNITQLKSVERDDHAAVSCTRGMPSRRTDVMGFTSRCPCSAALRVSSQQLRSSFQGRRRASPPREGGGG